LDSTGEGARWPLRLRDLCGELKGDLDSAAHQRVRREIWTILSHALERFIESDRPCCCALTPEDMEDLAAEKSLDLFRRIEAGTWELAGRTGPEVAGFLSATAHNAIIDLLRHRGRLQALSGSTSDRSAAGSEADPCCGELPDVCLETREFITALRDCVEGLQPRVRRVWFFRVFYGLATKEIAAHPDIGLSPPRIDELLFHVRQVITRCMEGKGQRSRQLPTGTFFEIWRSFRQIPVEEIGTNGQVLEPAS
jgi:DNA-directed RNA polymerase specialized sigma24 family protein